MNADQINQIKAKYRTHLSTADGREQLREAIEIKKMWKQTIANTDISINTACVKPRYIHTDLNKKITKIEITPIGLNNMCHLTSELLCDDKMGITKRLGFNITACPCGKLMSYEIHSVNKCGGQLYDFTKDFNDETHKYFLEMDTDMHPRLYIKMFGNDPITINRGCKCPISWNNAGQFKKTEKELLNHIRETENMIIKETPYGIMVSKKTY
jgi:hypothetical protein